MPSFKPETNKKIKYNKKSSITLDSKHKEFINEFLKDEKDVIPKLKDEKAKILFELKNNELNIEKKMDYQDRINEINNSIKNIRNKKKEYFLNNSKYIFDYFENKKNISENIEDKNNYDAYNESVKNNINNKNKIVEQFFKIKIDNENDKNELKTNNIVQNYLTSIDESFIDVNLYVFSTDVCQFCYKGELIALEDEGLMICNSCFHNTPYLIENEKPSYKEPPKEVCFYAYKRINHFKEIVAQFQGKETTQIPVEVIENIKQQIKKERIDLSILTNNKTKEILKKLGYNKFYEHISFIKDKLGIKPPIMSQELEETLFNLFAELQSPYSKFCPDNRVNFLNYYYTLYKFCELLGEYHFLKDIPMLKDREKRIDQDSIWKKICNELNWEYIPTI